MEEDTSITGKWIEIKKAMQSGAHVIKRGEEIRKGQTILSAGHVLDFRSTGIMAHMGISEVPVSRPRVGIISTGDEIVPVGEKNIPLGVTRDVNMEFLHSFFKKYGFCIKRYGISRDVKSELYIKTEQAVAENDIVLVSGGSSVSVKDFTSVVFEELLNSKLYLRGLRIRPGKPTLFAASKEKRKLLFGLPGHPLSCAVVASTFVLPVILNSIAPGSCKDDIQEFNLADDVNGTTGIEEFIPFRFSGGKISPIMSKSGYVGSLIDTDGLVVLSEQTETARKEELAGVMLWK
jgi:molybdopterin molybdotransferase